jgi:putative hydrolase of the HAD superfamily
MIKYIIFDLSEVLIAGIIGIEEVLYSKVPTPKEEIVKSFSGDWLKEYLVGKIDENIYLTGIIKKESWQIEIEELKKIIRNNFHTSVEGMLPIVEILYQKYKLILHSDHTKEWIEYIKSIHPFLNLFEQLFFSYELKMTKHNPESFRKVILSINANPDECLFIDDHLRNINNAELAGMRGIQFIDANLLKTELETRGIL